MSREREEPARIEILVEVKQVKLDDDILQGAEAMTVMRDEKKSVSVILYDSIDSIPKPSEVHLHKTH